MKVSAVIDKNVVSGTILLDSIVSIDLKLVHETSHNGIKNYIILDSVSVTPSQMYFDYSFLNPHYYTSLFVDVNGIKHPVLETDIEYTGESNPTNDRIYQQNELPELDDVVIEEQSMKNSFQEFGSILSHSDYVNLLDFSKFKSDHHTLYDSQMKLRFDVTTQDVVIYNKFVLNQAPEVTITVEGTKPDFVRLVLINSLGNERILNIADAYEAYGCWNYSSFVTSSTTDARVELVYLKDQFKEYRTVKIENALVAKVSQYFGASSATRTLSSVDVHLEQKVMYSFKAEHFPRFGLRTLLCIGNSEKHVIQVSNSKVLFKKISQGEVVYSTVTSDLIGNDLKVSVYVDSEVTRIYIKDELSKEVLGDHTIPAGVYNAIVGATEMDQDYESNTAISFSVYDQDLYE